MAVMAVAEELPGKNFENPVGECGIVVYRSGLILRQHKYFPCIDSTNLVGSKSITITEDQGSLW